MLDSEPGDTVEQRIREWLEQELSVPNAALGRTGAVCPFAGPCLSAGTVKFRTIPADPSPSLDVLLDAARDAARDFEGLDWAGAPEQLRCLIVTFSALGIEAARLLDEVHRRLKDDVVARGLMFAQFHPLCSEPSARNPQLNVGRSPVPMLVFRRLAVHDILFLEQRESWFEEYRRAYGQRFSKRSSLDPKLLAAYDRASARFTPAMSESAMTASMEP